MSVVVPITVVMRPVKFQQFPPPMGLHSSHPVPRDQQPCLTGPLLELVWDEESQATKENKL